MHIYMAELRRILRAIAGEDPDSLYIITLNLCSMAGVQ